jgi:hypothetical protein
MRDGRRKRKDEGGGCAEPFDGGIGKAAQGLEMPRKPERQRLIKIATPRVNPKKTRPANSGQWFTIKDDGF